MHGCVLRVMVGSDGLEDSLRAGAGFGLEEVRSAEWVSAGRTPRTRTLRARVSAASGERIERQIADAVAFVVAHEEALSALAHSEAVSACYLDFGWSFAWQTAARWGRFPRELLTRCADCGVEIEVSVFAERSRSRPDED